LTRAAIFYSCLLGGQLGKFEVLWLVKTGVRWIAGTGEIGLGAAQCPGNCTLRPLRALSEAVFSDDCTTHANINMGSIVSRTGRAACKFSWIDEIRFLNRMLVNGDELLG
jgi:hypothetical protein